MIAFPIARLNSKLSRQRGIELQTALSSDSVKGSLQKEIEIALLDGTIDLAVHSMKDLPTDLPDGLCIAAIPVREDPRDVLVTQSGTAPRSTPKGSENWHDKPTPKISAFTPTS